MSLTLWQEKRATSFEYGRYGNPTTMVAEEKIRFYFNLFYFCIWNLVDSDWYFEYWLNVFLSFSALEGAESTVIMASGMCASTTMFMALVPAGGHVVTTTDCYRKTRIFIETVLPKMGISVWDIGVPVSESRLILSLLIRLFLNFS